MKPSGASSSAPAPLTGPNTSERYVGQVISVEKIKKTIGTSDVTGEIREFLEVLIKVQEHVTLEPVEGPRTPVISSKPEPLAKESDSPKIKEIKRDVPAGQSVRFYFDPNEKLKVGDRVEVTTRSRQQISYGWVSEEHGATFRVLKQK